MGGPETPEMRAAFAEALSAELGAAQKKPGDISRLVGVTDDAVRKWMIGRSAPDPLTVFAIEELLGVPAGALSQHLGYIPAGAGESVLAALANDPKLSDDARLTLMGAYRAAVKGR